METEKYYRIGGIGLRVCGTEADAVASLDGMEVFAAPAGEALFTIRLKPFSAAARLPEEGRLLWRFEAEETVSRLCRTEDGYALTMVPARGEPLTLHRPAAGNECRIYGSRSPQLLRFALWIAYGLATVREGIVAVHASAIVCGRKAVLFLGESGTGKSTHTRLWRQHIPGAALLNDDSPLVRIPQEGPPLVYGSPWSGKTPCYRNESYPLAAIVRLSQAPANRIRRLRTPEAIGALYPSCPPAFVPDAALSEAICENLSVILTTVPVFHLECLPDEAAARLSFRTVFAPEKNTAIPPQNPVR